MAAQGDFDSNWANCIANVLSRKFHGMGIPVAIPAQYFHDKFARGSDIREVLDRVRDEGVVCDLYYGRGNEGCPRRPKSLMRALVPHYRIKGYKVFHKGGCDLKKEIKDALDSGYGPLIGGVVSSDALCNFQCPNGEIYKAEKEDDNEGESDEDNGQDTTDGHVTTHGHLKTDGHVTTVGHFPLVVESYKYEAADPNCHHIVARNPSNSRWGNGGMGNISPDAFDILYLVQMYVAADEMDLYASAHTDDDYSWMG